ncbi:MAG: DnaA N-terminal domain-containing protein [Gammaproteobacteria bacterium]
MSVSSVWSQCLDTLQKELPAQQYNTWIRPLQAEFLPKTDHPEPCARHTRWKSV